MPSASRWFVGSSSSRSVGSPTSTRASMSRACSPPDSVPSRASSGSALTPRRSRTSATRAAYAQPPSCPYRSWTAPSSARRPGSVPTCRLQRAQPPVQCRQLARCGVEILTDGHRRVGHLLGEVADPRARRKLDVPGGRAELAGNDLEHGRLAGTVRPDKTDAVRAGHGEGGVREQRLVAVGGTEIDGFPHTHTRPRAAGIGARSYQAIRRDRVRAQRMTTSITRPRRRRPPIWPRGSPSGRASAPRVRTGGGTRPTPPSVPP